MAQGRRISLRPMTAAERSALEHITRAGSERAQRTFPSAVPLFALDRVYTRGLACLSTTVPRSSGWARMSDHLPLLVELELD